MNKYAKYTILLIIFSTFLRIALAVNYPVSGDALWHVNIARFMAENKVIPLFEPLGREVFWSPPFFHFLMAFVYGSFSFIELEKFAITGMKLVSPLMASLSLIFSFLIIKRLYDGRIAFFGTFFISFLPIHIYLSSILYVDITFMAIFLSAIYFSIRENYVIAGILAGFSIFTKFNGILLVPVILFFIYNRKKNVFRNSFKFLLSLIPIGSIWIIRNWYYLGNPIYPFLNSVFNGYVGANKDYATGIISNLFSTVWIKTAFGEIIGIPSGNFDNLLILNSLFLKVGVFIWLSGCLIYLVPLVNREGIKKYKFLFSVWVVPFVAFSLLYIYNTGTLYFRFSLAILPLFGVFWAFGIVRFLESKRKKLVIFSLLLLICFGFISVELFKVKLSSNVWDNYNEDFKEINKIVSENESILTNLDPQLVAFRTKSHVYNLKTVQDNKVNFVLIEEGKRFIECSGCRELYYNNRTKVKLYEAKK